MNPNLTPLIPISQFCSTFSWPSESAMRGYIAKAKEYGLEECFVRIGRRVLVDPAKFFDLIRKVNK